MAPPTEWDAMRERLLRNRTKAELRDIARAEGAACSGYKEEIAAAIVANRRRLAEGGPAPKRGRFGDYMRVEPVTWSATGHGGRAYGEV